MGRHQPIRAHRPRPRPERSLLGPRAGIAALALASLALAQAAGQGPAGAGSAASEAANRGERDLSGIWEVTMTAGLVGPSVLCRMVPELNATDLDTVSSARNLEELIYAVIPDSSIAWFESVCDPIFSGENGDQVSGECLISLVWGNPCTLVADLSFEGALDRNDRFTCVGLGDVRLGGPGLCPKTTCPGRLKIVARRVGALP